MKTTKQNKNLSCLKSYWGNFNTELYYKYLKTINN